MESKEIETCDICNKAVGSAEAKLGWPIHLSDGTGGADLVCPECYGGEAYCSNGHVLPANNDSSDCPSCDPATRIKTALETAIESGSPIDLDEIAHRLGYDVCSEHTGDSGTGVAILIPGWITDDGNATIEYEDAEDGAEAAQDYVGDGDWGQSKETVWVHIQAWREGYAITSDPDDPEDEPEVVEVEAYEEGHTVQLDPEEPECSEGEHNWYSPTWLGGCKENPGVWGHGGGVIIREVCSNCGWYRITDTWAQDPSNGVQGLESVAYEKPDDTSLEATKGKAK